MAIATGFRKAERKQAKLRLGLAGPAGSGKTASSLLIAFGITEDWSKIGLVDTENGSGELYAGATIGGIRIGDYNVLPLSPPYMPEKYIQAIHLAEEAGLEVLILDSISHAWAGDGGLLDLHSKITSSSKSNNSYTAWREVTPLHNRFVEAMLQSQVHIIATMRSKVEYAVESGKDGKTNVRKLGMAPVQREGMDYEFTTVLDISLEHVVSSSKDRTSLFDGRYFTPGPDTGKALKEWLETGSELVEFHSTGAATVTNLADRQTKGKDTGEKAGGSSCKENKAREENTAPTNLKPLIQVIQKYNPDMTMVGKIAMELTGKHSPSELTAEEVLIVAHTLEARLNSESLN